MRKIISLPINKVAIPKSIQREIDKQCNDHITKRRKTKHKAQENLQVHMAK